MGCTGGIWKYLLYSLIHKLFVVGFRCGRGRMSDQHIADICNLPPVNITLSDCNVTLSSEDNMGATLDYISDNVLGENPAFTEKKANRLRSENHKLAKHLEKCKDQTRELDSVRERWSNLDFKYKLLMDMWALRALDGEKGGARSPRRSPPHRSPRHSPPHQSPRRSPQQSPRQSPGQSPDPPRHSPQQSPRRSPRQSPRPSPRQSPRPSPRQSPRPSPHQSPRESPPRPKPPTVTVSPPTVTVSPPTVTVSPPTPPHSPPHSPLQSPSFPTELKLSPRGGRDCLNPNVTVPLTYTSYSSKRIIKTTTRDK